MNTKTAIENHSGDRSGPISSAEGIGPKVRIWVITASLLALFIGAMDALIMSAAMPTIITDLGGLHLYSWVYASYFLSRAVALPIFGKLADLFKIRILFLISIGIFLVSSIVAGLAPNLMVLIIARVFQGIGAGGNFAQVYVVLADIAPPGKRAKTLSLASSIWGIASVLGPTLGGFIVTYFSWRWIFFINVPICLLSMALIAAFLVETRRKKETVHLDMAGVTCLSTTVLGFLILLMLGGRDFEWYSTTALTLIGITLLSGIAFYFAEKRAREPILPLHFFKIRSFSIGNGCVFLSSFAIFSLFAYAPLFIQGVLGKTPMEVGLAMLSLSLGWSIGSLALGQLFSRLGRKAAAIIGALLLSLGGGLTVGFDPTTTMSTCFWVFQVVGLGMGFVTLSTLLIVQGGLGSEDLGVATSSHQFARTMGGAVGVGACGGLVIARITGAIENLSGSGQMAKMPALADGPLRDHIERIFQPEIQSLLNPELHSAIQQAVGTGVRSVFWMALAVSLLCLALCLCLPPGKPKRE